MRDRVQLTSIHAHMEKELLISIFDDGDLCVTIDDPTDTKSIIISANSVGSLVDMLLNNYIVETKITHTVTLK